MGGPGEVERLIGQENAGGENGLVVLEGETEQSGLGTGGDETREQAPEMEVLAFAHGQPAFDVPLEDGGIGELHHPGGVELNDHREDPNWNLRVVMGQGAARPRREPCFL